MLRAVVHTDTAACTPTHNACTWTGPATPYDGLMTDINSIWPQDEERLSSTAGGQACVRPMYHPAALQHRMKPKHPAKPHPLLQHTAQHPAMKTKDDADTSRPHPSTPHHQAATLRPQHADAGVMPAHAQHASPPPLASVSAALSLFAPCIPLQHHHHHHNAPTSCSMHPSAADHNTRHTMQCLSVPPCLAADSLHTGAARRGRPCRRG